MEKLRVSIIIPVYNGSNFLGQAIDSALNQDYENKEILVINDGSSDDGATRRLALSYGSRIRYLEKENGGTASALNYGIRAMTGDYFSWLSHDDLFMKTKLTDQMRAMRDSGTTISQGNYRLFSEEGGGSVTTSFQRYYDEETLERASFLFFWAEEHFSSLLFHRGHFDRVGQFDERLDTAQDNEFMFRLLRGQRVAFVERPVSAVRLHKDSGTSLVRDVVDAENRKLFLRLAGALSETESRQIFGEQSTFLCKVAGIIKSMGGEKELRLIEEQMAKAILEERGQAFRRIDALEDACRAPVLFGAGQYGIRLKYELSARGIEPAYFVDNDPRKAGTRIDGIPCRTVEHLRDDPGRCVIITQKLYDAAYRQLREIGIGSFRLKEEVDALLLRSAPRYIPSGR